MNTLILSTVAVFLILHMACGKQQVPLHLQHKVARAGEILSVITQATKDKRSLVRPSRQVGSCSADDVATYFSDYPADCAVRLTGIDFNAIGSGDLEIFADFTAVFCNERCGQPIMDLFYDCNIPEDGVVLVYICSVNENGATCGSILQAVIDVRAAAETACLPRSTSCSNDCQTTLQNIQGTAGCCGNLTEVENQLFGVAFEVNDFTLWNSCGVDITGLCTEGPLELTDSGEALIVTRVVFIGLAILSAMVLLL